MASPMREYSVRTVRNRASSTSATCSKIHDFVADGGARQVGTDRQHHHRRARREIREAVDQRRNKKQEALHRNELAPWHQMNLAVDRGRAAVGCDEEGGVVKCGL